MSISLDADISEVSGVGIKTKALLARHGIHSVRDLLYCLPRTYENYQTSMSIKDIHPGRITVRGKVSETKVCRTNRRNLSVTEAIIYDNTDAIRAVWFNQPYRATSFDKDREYIFSGSYEMNHGKYQLTSPSVHVAKDAETPAGSASFRPIYRAKGSFKSENFEKIIGTLRSDFAFIPDLVPISSEAPDFIKPGVRAESLFKSHFAENNEDVESARTYLAYEELFTLILAATMNREESSKLKSTPLPFNEEKIKSLINSLPFKLTNSQRRATWEILKDLEKTTPMNRLLQGDVGSGKTIVSAITAFQCIADGHQVALLAPTAILATQHAEGLLKILEPLGVRICLLIGSTKHKKEVKKRIKNGDYDLIIGTHALITDDTEFHSLALCIIDEQHRFGVNQRRKLLEKTPIGTAPHLLSMSATPIPRSLQLTIFGDLDVSILDELPAGRQPVTTKITSNLAFTDIVYPKVREFLAKGQQVYWICKTIEGNPTSSKNSVMKMTEHLKTIFTDANISPLHGRMKPDEKDRIMSDFENGKIDILVSTTVVEVGVNVPNANLMIIMNSEDYGLAQIHQLRGRIGRGHDAALCYLVTDGDNEPTKRLKELEKSTDGFYLAEVDLKIRGPGEIYGSLQHGALNLNIATLADTKLIRLASIHAKSFLKSHPDMLQYKELDTAVKKYQQLTTLN